LTVGRFVVVPRLLWKFILKSGFSISADAIVLLLVSVKYFFLFCELQKTTMNLLRMSIVTTLRSTHLSRSVMIFSPL